MERAGNMFAGGERAEHAVEGIARKDRAADAGE
jgi:hypothetical protein